MPGRSLRFEAIGTRWQIDTDEPLPPTVKAAVMRRIDEFDRTWSRFRDDSLVARIAAEPGAWALPAEAGPLFSLYRRLYEATDGAVSPLVGRSLEALGYDRAITLRPGPPRPAPRWEDTLAWDGATLTAPRPVSLDVGAAGKGCLVDLVDRVLLGHGIHAATVDASGDVLHRGPGRERVALEHPARPGYAVGVAMLSNRALAASAVNRRAWGNGLHHVLDATTGLPTREVIATWALADSALVADGLATALFFADAERLDAAGFDFEFVRMHADGRLEWSPSLEGEVFG